MTLEDKVAEYLKGSPQSKAREIAAALGIDRGDVNSTLYRGANTRFHIDGEYRWTFIGSTNGEALVRAVAPTPSSHIETETAETVLRARRTLARLKRGVPPTEAIDSLAIGMEPFQRQLDQVLSGNAAPRWLGVVGEYGEGKSFFRAYACRRAMEAGFAVASLDVNKDEGALHQPQRHLAIVLESLQSPQSLFAGQQGIKNLLRHWLSHSSAKVIERSLIRLRRVTPWMQVNWEVISFASVTRDLGPTAAGVSNVAYLLRFLSGEDLVIKGNYARFSAAYRLQLVIEWLRLTGHKGLFLFVDELDNVIRQIHARAHPACFRTLAWYCSNKVTPELRVALATTPEGMDILDEGGRRAYGHMISELKASRAEENEIYEQWNREARRLASRGWERCVSLNVKQRVDLFQRIGKLHATAWRNSKVIAVEEVNRMAASRAFSTTRRWVRACVQLLDILDQHRQGE